MESFACSCPFLSLSTVIYSMLLKEFVCMEFGSRIQLNRWLKCLAQNVVWTGCYYVRCGNDFQLALLRIQAISKIHKFTYHIVIKNMCSNDKRPSFISIFLFFLFLARSPVCMHEYFKLFHHFSSWSFRFFFSCPLSIWTENQWKKIVTNVQIGRIIFALCFSYLLS